MRQHSLFHFTEPCDRPTMVRLATRTRPPSSDGKVKKRSTPSKGGGGAASKSKAKRLRPTNANDYEADQDELEEVRHKNKYDVR